MKGTLKGVGGGSDPTVGTLEAKRLRIQKWRHAVSLRRRIHYDVNSRDAHPVDAGGEQRAGTAKKNINRPQ